VIEAVPGASEPAQIEITPTPWKATGRSPDDHQAVAAALKAHIETLKAELARIEAAAAVHGAPR